MPMTEEKIHQVTSHLSHLNNYLFLNQF